MKTLLALIVVGTFSFSLAYNSSYLDGLWEDDEVASGVGPNSIVLNKKVYNCTDHMRCGCPMLLCTGNKICERQDENPIKCRLTKPYEKIDLQKAKIEYFFKGSGDCKCNPL